MTSKRVLYCVLAVFLAAMLWAGCAAAEETSAVTITASGDGSYYIGEAIKLFGTNTDTNDIYLFLIGPSLEENGIQISTLPNKNPAKDVPSLSATPSTSTVAKGDFLYIRGTAEDNPDNLSLYIFGPNFFEPYSVSVKDDGSYEKKIEIPSGMSSNQYFVVVQHPRENKQFDAKLVAIDKNGNTVDGVTWPNEEFQWNFSTTTSNNPQSFIVWGNPKKLQGANAADALTKMIDSANNDDIYTKLTFTVAEPWIRINSVGNKAVGSKFTITGTTNLAADDQIRIEVLPSDSQTSVFSQSTTVVKGDGSDNTWSVEVDTTGWADDEYTITSQGIGIDGTASTTFIVGNPEPKPQDPSDKYAITVVKGDYLSINGTARHTPDMLMFYVFGPNYFQDYTVYVGEDGTYGKAIDILSSMSSNDEYSLIIHHPMKDGIFDAKFVAVDKNGKSIDPGWSDSSCEWAFMTKDSKPENVPANFFYVTGNNKLSGSQAAEALIKMIEEVDDTCTNLTFAVAKPWIGIDNPGDMAIGSKFTISGTTNLAVDDQILVEVMSSSFDPTDKTSDISGVSGVTKVVAENPKEYSHSTDDIDVFVTTGKKNFADLSPPKNLTITASTNGVPKGDTITFSGTNLATDNVFLFITGPNLNYDEIVLTSLPKQLPAYNATTPIKDNSDKTWKYTWNTANCNLDYGAYTIYATSKLTNGKSSSKLQLDENLNSQYKTYGTPHPKNPNDYYAVKLSQSDYATVSINLRSEEGESEDPQRSRSDAANDADTSGFGNVKGMAYFKGSEALSATAGKRTDNTWSLEIDTTGWKLDEYTIKVNAIEVDVSTTTNFNIVKPTITLTPVKSDLQESEQLTARGAATGSPGSVQYYLFGQDTYIRGSTPVNADNSYEVRIPTTHWETGIYHLVVEHPMYNKIIDILETKSGTTTTLSPQDPTGTTQHSVTVEGSDKIQGSEAATALIRMISDANIDDISASATFTVTKRSTIPATTPSSVPTVYSDGNMDNALRILFETNGGGFISPVTGLSYGDIMPEPPEPKRDGYTFSGWYTDSACTKAWNFADTIPGDMTLYAKWIEEGSSKSVPTTKPTTQQPSAAQTTQPTTIQTPVSPSPAPAGTTAAQATLSQVPAPLAGLLLGLGAAALLIRRRN